MLEARGGLCLATEALDEGLAPGQLTVEDLDGDASAQPLVLGDIDIGHAAAGEVRDQCVAPCEDVLGFHDFGAHGTGDTANRSRFGTAARTPAGDSGRNSGGGEVRLEGPADGNEAPVAGHSPVIPTL
jgi:hypothetical protein